MRRLLPIIILIVALAFGMWLGLRPVPKPQLGPSLRVDFIDVGQGDSILIHTPDGAAALIDAGEREYGPRVVNHLRRRGVKQLDLVVMTHPHSDHIGGMLDVLDAFPVKRVLDSGFAHGSRTQERVLREIEVRRIRYSLARAGMATTLGEQVRLEILGPPEEMLDGTESDANNNSVVMRLVFGNTRMLLTGDVQMEGEAAIIASRQDIKSQVMKISHHGSSDSSSLEMIRSVGPEYVIISVGAGNPYHHPHKKVLRRLDKSRTGATMYRTDKNGTVSALTDGQNIVVETQK